jgi:hypothetical protein
MNGIQIIEKERLRQQKVEGWTPEHDALHTDGSLARVAACYALQNADREHHYRDGFSVPRLFYQILHS